MTMSFGSLEQSRQIFTSEVYSYAITVTFFKLNTEPIFTWIALVTLSLVPLMTNIPNTPKQGRSVHSLARVPDGNMH